METPEISVKGYVGKPVIARGNRNYENYFINGRYIKSTVICRAIEEAYKPFMMQHKYPFTLLHFTIEPELLDVNVHPTKMELRFRDGEMIYHQVYRAVSGALAHRELIPEVALQKKPENREVRAEWRKGPAPEPFEKQRRVEMESQNKVFGTENQKEAEKEKPIVASAIPKRLTPLPPFPSYVREKNDLAENWLAGNVQAQAEGQVQSGNLHQIQNKNPNGESLPPAKQLDLFDGKLLEPKARSKHKLIGQLFDTYWLVEFNDQLYMIDQHAAHEKVLYEKTMATLKNREFSSQLLTPPVILTLNRNEELLLNRHLKYFAEMGFEIEPFGGREYAVRGVPSNLFSLAKKELLLEMIDGLSENGSSFQPGMIYERVASLSCKGAVKGGHSLSVSEANELIDQLLNLENPYTCPHGRPTIVSMSRQELERKFKRIV